VTKGCGDDGRFVIPAKAGTQGSLFPKVPYLKSPASEASGSAAIVTCAG
jgi:hypothetical protein